MASNLVSYYCALRGVPQESEEPHQFQAAEKDLIRETAELELPSVPADSPQKILRDSSSEIDSDIITYPDPPDTVYVIPITESQEKLRRRSSTSASSSESYPDPPPEGTIYIIPITEEPEDDLSADTESQETKEEEKENLEEIQDNQEEPEENQDSPITYPDPPGAYYVIPISRKDIPPQAPVHRCWMPFAQGVPNRSYGSYFPNFAPYYSYAPYYPAPYMWNYSGMQYGYRPVYMTPQATPTAPKPENSSNSTNYSPAYLNPSLYSGRTQMCGIPYNSAPNEPAGPNSYIARRKTEKANQLFEDMFSRADKTDDGGLTFEEFQNYFRDAVLSDDELLCLFNNMDSNKNGNIELRELVDYFTESFDPYREVFDNLASVNNSLSASITETFKSYPQEERFEQFRTRVYVKEIIRQINSLKNSVEASLDTMIGSNRSVRSAEGGYEGLIANNVIRSSGSIPVAVREENSSSELYEQIERLSSIVGELSGRGILKQSKQDFFDVNSAQEECYVVIMRQYTVIPEMALHFRDATRIYINHVKQAGGNLQIYVKQSLNKFCFTLYEIWEDDSYLAIHHQSMAFRQYQKDLIESLEVPASVDSMELPCSWWN